MKAIQRHLRTLAAKIENAKVIAFFSLIILIIPFSQAAAATFTVSSNPIWTDTGITVHATENVTFSNATASWTWGYSIAPFGPDGDYLPNGSGDEWIQNDKHGELIGFIGDPSLNLNDFPHVISPKPQVSLKLVQLIKQLEACRENFGWGLMMITSAMPLMITQVRLQ